MASPATVNGDGGFVYPRIDDVPSSKDFYLNNPDPDHDVDISDQPFGSTRKLRVVILGSGISGINFFKFAEDKASDLEIQCYEKNEDIGGTWLENRYPGCACDVEHHCRLFSLLANPLTDPVGRLPISMAACSMEQILFPLSRDLEVRQDGRRRK